MVEGRRDADILALQIEAVHAAKAEDEMVSSCPVFGHEGDDAIVFI